MVDEIVIQIFLITSSLVWSFLVKKSFCFSFFPFYFGNEADDDTGHCYMIYSFHLLILQKSLL